jgi:hypothetical protein
MQVGTEAGGRKLRGGRVGCVDGNTQSRKKTRSGPWEPATRAELRSSAIQRIAFPERLSESGYWCFGARLLTICLNPHASKMDGSATWQLPEK